MFRLLAVLLVGFGMAVSCSADVVDTVSDPSFSPASVKRLAVLVIGQLPRRPDEPHSRYGAPTTGNLENNQQNFQRFIEDEFVTALMKKHYTTISRSDLPTIEKERRVQMGPASQGEAIDWGKKLNVPMVMVVSITEFGTVKQEGINHRKGYRSVPADGKVQVTAALDARLISVSNTKLLWSGKCRISVTVADFSAASGAIARLARITAQAFPERPVVKDEPEEPKPIVENKQPTFTFEGKYAWEKGIMEFLPGGKVSKSWHGDRAEWVSLGESKYKIITKGKDKHNHEHKSYDSVTMMPDGSLSVSSADGKTWTATRMPSGNDRSTK